MALFIKILGWGQAKIKYKFQIFSFLQLTKSYGYGKNIVTFFRYCGGFLFKKYTVQVMSNTVVNPSL